MSFTPLMMKLVATLRDALPESPTVVELGNQTFDPTISGRLADPADLMLPRVLSYLGASGRPFDRAAIERLMGAPWEQVKPCTADYFKALGFASYDAIDVNTKYGSLVMDLNADLSERYGFNQTFDLVTNNGTGEHIFNQYAVFRNMHQLTKVGGIQLFVLPFHNWLNHGFFNFNPILFGDLAAANGYRIVRLSVATPEGAEVGVGRDGAPTGEMALAWQPLLQDVRVEEMQQRGSVNPLSARLGAWGVAQALMGRPALRQASRLPEMIRKLAERSVNVNVVAALQKQKDGDFAVPLQGMYAGSNVEAQALKDAYRI